jgi:hypothetical protein
MRTKQLWAIGLAAAMLCAGANATGRDDNKTTNQAGAVAFAGASSQQGQGQHQTATGGKANQGQGQGQGQSTDNANNAAQSTNVTLHGDTATYAAQERNPTSTAYAPSFAPTAVCALGASAGAQGAAFGITFGGSYIDKNCELLEQVRAAQAIGARDVAMEMMLDVPAFAAASKRLAARKQGPVAEQSPAAPVAAAGTQYADPIIRKRLGLQPL